MLLLSAYCSVVRSSYLWCSVVVPTSTTSRCDKTEFPSPTADARPQSRSLLHPARSKHTEDQKHTHPRWVPLRAPPPLWPRPHRNWWVFLSAPDGFVGRSSLVHHGLFFIGMCECVGYVTASSSSGLLWRMEMGMVQFLIGDFVKNLRAVYGVFGI